MNTYNTNPWYDDFSDEKDFHQILFKPGFAVQARELTQLQSILKDQIAKFGNHIFKHGSVVIPGNSISDLAVPYVKIAAGSTNLASFNNQTIVGTSSGVEAIVKTVVPATTTESAVFYLTYTAGNSAGNVMFQSNEVLYLKASPSITVTTTVAATGVGSIAYINKGVYYINGTFATVMPQSVIISKYTSVPSCHVLLKINETIVNSTDDETLLDPAQGSYNYAAPGADRVKLSLELVTLPLDSTISSDYVEIMRFNEGVLEEHANNPKYSELEKSLARRTFDESGNYVVNGLVPSVREHLKSGPNNGVYSSGDTDKLVVDVTPGKAYISGYEVEKLANTKIAIDKARTANHIKETNVTLRPEYGQYIIVSNIVGYLSVYNHETVTLYNDNDPAQGAATNLGTAKVIGIDYLETGIYKLWLTDISLLSGNTIYMVGGIRYGSTYSAYVLTKYAAPVSGGGFSVGEIITHISGRTATVKYWDSGTSTVYAYKHLHTQESPRIGDQVVGSVSASTSILSDKEVIVSVGQNGLIFRLTKPVLHSLKDATTLNYDLSYTVQKELTIVTNASGTGDASVGTGEVINPIEVGSFIAVGPTGTVSNSLFSLNILGSVLTLTGGPVSSTVKVYATVLKTNVAPKTKTLTTGTITIPSPTSTLTLDKTDIVGITSVIDSVGDITANYDFWNGQSDYSYNLGTLKLKSGKSAPSGSVTVTFKYYAHSISGDFFCINSYSTGILESTTVYSSNTTGQVYDLPACIDFRPSVGVNGTFTGANSRRNDLLVSETTFNTNLQYYVPRIDVLTVDVSGKMNVITGIPSEEPKSPNVPGSQFAIDLFFIPAYTKTSAEVTGSRLAVERYTMSDIKQLGNRVDRVENFATLTASELSVTGQIVIDAATGLNKFKTGYMVENFTQPLTIARTTSDDYAAIFVGNTMQPKMENVDCELLLVESSSNYYIKNGILMLPYTEEVFASQKLSSRVSNLNPFLVIRWDGLLGVFPPSDNWSDIRELPSIFESTTEEVVVNTYSTIACPLPPVPPLPPVEPVTPVVPVAPVVPPPLPPTTYGGWYGDVVGRYGEFGGVSYWSNATVNGMSSTELAGYFLSSAKANFNTDAYRAQGYESKFNDTISVEALAKNDVLTSKTEYMYGDNNSIIAVNTVTKLDGRTSTTNSVYKP